MERVREPLSCGKCGAPMNHHADKLVEPRTRAEMRQMDPALGGIVEEMRTCPGCGNVEARRVGLST